MANIPEDIQEKRDLIEDALYDMQVKRVHIKEWHQDVLELIKELKKLEKEAEIEEPKWKEYMEKFKKIQTKEKKQAMKKKKQRR